MIEKHGNMRITIPSSDIALAQNSASINNYSIIIINSSTSSRTALSHPYSTSDISIDLGNNFRAGTYKISITAVDSRNNESEPVEKSFFVLLYSPPTTSGIVLERVNGYEKEVIANITSFYSKLLVGSAIKNSIASIRYRYAKKDDAFSSWISLTGFTISHNAAHENLMTLSLTRDYSHEGYLFTNFIPEYAYIVQFGISDKISTSTADIIVSAGIPIMFRGDNGQVAIGRIPDFSDSSKLQVANDILATDMLGNERKILDSINNFIICNSSEPINQIIGGVWFKEE